MPLVSLAPIERSKLPRPRNVKDRPGDDVNVLDQNLASDTVPIGAILHNLVNPGSDHMQTTITVRNLRSVNSRTIYALLDADVEIGGVVVSIVGIQARHLPAGGTSVHLPTFRDTDGVWRAAVILPEEVREAMSDAVLDFMVEEGVAKAAPSQLDAEADTHVLL